MNWDKASEYVGKPWEEGATGPDTFDCWQLCVAAALDLYGIEFPPVAYTHVAPDVVSERAAEQIRGGKWKRIDTHQPGAVVALSFPVPGEVTHVGLMLDASMVLHSERKNGSAINPLHNLATVYYVEGIYQWAPSSD